MGYLNLFPQQNLSLNFGSTLKIMHPYEFSFKGLLVMKRQKPNLGKGSLRKRDFCVKKEKPE
jgi:hypothetical protein